jgi:hypothetical protein
MLVTVVLKFSAMLCVDAWFAIMPAGMEIMIAMEKPKATITSAVLILRLDMFLIALVKAPKVFHPFGFHQNVVAY